MSNVQVVLPDHVLESGSLCVEDGHIVEIVEGPGPEQGAGTRLDGQGLLVLPGLIDIHGDMLEREINPRPRSTVPIDLALYELDKRMVATGVTTAYAAISFAWHKEDSLRSEARAREIMETVNLMRPTLLADHRVHARFEITNPDAGQVLEELLQRDQVHLISIMDHTPGQGQYRDIEGYVQYSVEWSQRTGENLSEEEVRSRIGMRLEQPKGWAAVRAIADHARQHGVILASHDDDTVQKVELMHQLGVGISEFPVTVEAAQTARDLGLHVAMGAPNALQGFSTSNNLSALDAIAAGLVDTLAADYYPAAMLHTVFAFAEQGILPLHEAVKLVTTNPADGLHLHDRGALAVGRQADLVFVEYYGANAGGSGLGLGARPRVRGTLRQGVPVYWDSYMAQLPVYQSANPDLESTQADYAGQ
ncbi:MAG: alpha-D-ribose 1-methylphosphonate 5-triphosphate diphosphatase [Litorilinea sp.]